MRSSSLHLRGRTLRALVPRWGAVFLWMLAIFYFSSRPDPLGFLGPLGRFESLGIVAHMFEYFGLVGLILWALSARPGSPSLKNAWLSVAIALAYAVVDEAHQKFVPGRSFELADLGYDLAGIAAAFIVVRMRRTAPVPPTS